MRIIYERPTPPISTKDIYLTLAVIGIIGGLGTFVLGLLILLG